MKVQLLLGAAACIAATAFFLLPKTPKAEPPSYERTVFYFSAHPDDWQLFMGASAYRDVADKKTKVVFIHTTAGDAGNGTRGSGRRHPYYVAREEGSRAAIRFMVDAHALPEKESLDPLLRSGGHRVLRTTYGNTASYFFRLPDGHPSGSGFEGTDFQSLRKFANGKRPRIISIDRTAQYDGWNDLSATVRAIIERELSGRLEIHVAEGNEDLNPDDHSDHLATAKLALDAIKGMCAKKFFHVEYADSALPPNLSQEDSQNQAAVFAVTVSTINRFDIWSSWEPGHRQWLGREYVRVEDGSCHAQK